MADNPGGRHGYYDDERREEGYGGSGYGGYQQGHHGRDQDSGYGQFGGSQQPDYSEEQPHQGGYGGYQQGQHGRQQDSGYGQYGGSQQPEEGGYGGYTRHEEQLPEHQRRPAQTSQIGDESQQLFKIYCEANPDYFITVKDDSVVLSPGDESNPQQQFIKDCKWGSRVQDEAGFPAFVIVHKASGLALKHGSSMNDQVTLGRYNPETLDETILWTLSDDVGNGYQCLRPVGNIHLNLDAHSGGNKIRSGTELILFKWNKQENQKWKIFPIDNKSATHDYERPQHEYPGAEPGYGGGGHGYGRPTYSDY